jgi:hypothetical protein
VPEKERSNGIFEGLVEGEEKRDTRRKKTGFRLRNYWNFYFILFGKKETY